MKITEPRLTAEAVDMLDNMLEDCIKSEDLLRIIQYLLDALRESESVFYKNGELFIK